MKRNVILFLSFFLSQILFCQTMPSSFCGNRSVLGLTIEDSEAITRFLLLRSRFHDCRCFSVSTNIRIFLIKIYLWIRPHRKWSYCAPHLRKTGQLAVIRKSGCLLFLLTINSEGLVVLYYREYLGFARILSTFEKPDDAFPSRLRVWCWSLYQIWLLLYSFIRNRNPHLNAVKRGLKHADFATILQLSQKKKNQPLA